MMAGPQNPVPRAGALPDAPRGNWVDRAAPEAWKPFLKLARFDRPIGAWLLLFPCWWSQALAEHALGLPYPNPWYLALFYIGAFVMRDAGVVVAVDDVVIGATGAPHDERAREK